MDIGIITSKLSLFEKQGGQATSVMKLNTEFTDNTRLGLGNKNIMMVWNAEYTNSKNNYFQDERGQLKYRLVTGKLLDYQA
jgi:hypothetical protein